MRDGLLNEISVVVNSGRRPDDLTVSIGYRGRVTTIQGYPNPYQDRRPTELEILQSVARAARCNPASASHARLAYLGINPLDLLHEAFGVS
jgi:hypothetical protein